MVRFTERFSPAAQAAGRRGTPRVFGLSRIIREVCLLAVLCLVLTLVPAGLSSSLADTPGSG